MQNDSIPAPLDAGVIVAGPDSLAAPAGPPSNDGFMVAAYLVTAAIVLGYAWSLWVRGRAVWWTGSSRPPREP